MRLPCSSACALATERAAHVLHPLACCVIDLHRCQDPLASVPKKEQQLAKITDRPSQNFRTVFWSCLDPMPFEYESNRGWDKKVSTGYLSNVEMDRAFNYMLSLKPDHAMMLGDGWCVRARTFTHAFLVQRLPHPSIAAVLLSSDAVVRLALKQHLLTLGYSAGAPRGPGCCVTH